MPYPDIQSYRKDRYQPLFRPRGDRRFYMGRSMFDLFDGEEAVPVNVRKQGELLTLEVGLPGFAKEDLEVSVADDVLLIKAEREEEKEIVEGEYIQKEMHLDRIERRIQLPSGTGKEEVSADFQNGLLRITITDVSEELEQRVKRIEIK